MDVKIASKILTAFCNERKSCKDCYMHDNEGCKLLRRGIGLELLEEIEDRRNDKDWIKNLVNHCANNCNVVNCELREEKCWADLVYEKVKEWENQ